MAEDKLGIAGVKAELQKGLKLFKAFEHAEAVLASLEGLEATAKSLEKVVANLRQEADEIAVKNLAAAAALKLSQDEETATKQRATEEYSAIIQQARDEAATMIEKAEAEVAKLTDDVDAMAKQVDAKAVEKQGLEADIKRLEKQKADFLAKLKA